MMKFSTMIIAALWAGTVLASDGLEEAFTHPPDSAKPGVWWHWMGCNVTKEGITRDLEAFKEAGIGGATLFGMADICTPWAGAIPNSPTDGLIAFTDPWWELVRHAAAEARRLGLDLGMHASPGYNHSGASWVPPELSMQEICSSQTAVTGGERFAGNLARPTVDPHSRFPCPVFNKDTGKCEKPIIEARSSFYRDIAVLALPAEGVVAKETIIDLTGKMSAGGELQWDAPAGNWIVYRIGYTTMGVLCHPCQWEARGLESDKMSAEATEFYMGHFLGEMKKHLGDLVGTGLKHVLFDSYEAGTPSWTPRMAEEFGKRRAYELKPFLATFAGRVVGSDGETARFKRDFGNTVTELYRDVHFAIVSRMLHEANLAYACEPYGMPINTEMVAPYIDRMMTEFWTGNPIRGVIRGKINPGFFNAGSGQRRTVLEAEAFTGQPGDSQWSEYPGGLKILGDNAFCVGINRLVFHSNPHQPWDDRHRPGISMGQWGTHFGRLQTWWEPGKAWIAYLYRCQALLQWGRSAPDDFTMESEQGGLLLRVNHRSGEDADLFFVANQTDATGVARCSFKVTGRQPELWDPVTGSLRDLPAFDSAADQTRLTLEFAPAQSWFVVFRKKTVDGKSEADGRPVVNFPTLKPLQELPGPWTVAFDSKWGGPAEPVTFAKLEDWTKRPEPGIRYYSGTAAYRTAFDGSSGAWLDLGSFRHLARVRLNSRDLGVVWCAPFRVAIPKGLLKPSGNKLEIEITNV